MVDGLKQRVLLLVSADYKQICHRFELEVCEVNAVQGQQNSMELWAKKQDQNRFYGSEKMASSINRNTSSSGCILPFLSRSNALSSVFAFSNLA